MGHLADNDETYWNHLKFAGGIGIRMVYTGLVFLVHGIIPAIPVPISLNINETLQFMKRSKRYADKRVVKKIQNG